MDENEVYTNLFAHFRVKVLLFYRIGSIISLGAVMLVLYVCCVSKGSYDYE